MYHELADDLVFYVLVLLFLTSLPENHLKDTASFRAAASCSWSSRRHSCILSTLAVLRVSCLRAMCSLRYVPGASD